MKATLSRLVAALLLVIPGIAATYGFLAMKDALFALLGSEDSLHSFPWGKFLIGLLLFALGAGFIGGWIFFRDRKRNYVAPRFKAKKRR
jgi:hypothetical protein